MGDGRRTRISGKFGTALAGVASLALLAATPALGAMPTPQACAAGRGEGLTLGEHLGSVALCASVAGHTLVYAGGNPTLPCGTIVAGDQATPAAQDANGCDTVLDLPPRDQLDFGFVLPKGYASSSRRYPVLYLLSSGYPSEWPMVDPHLQDIANLGVIIVLPNQGYGFYSDWYSGAHHFETLDTTALINYVDHHFRTIADRQHRAVAGSSKAGYGAMLFAARHPDLYAAAASFSGIVDIADPSFRYVFAAELRAGFGTYSDPGSPTANPIWGDSATESVFWHDRDPTDLASNLRGIELYQAAGDGVVPPEEAAASGPTIVLGSNEEALVRVQNTAFDAALTRDGIAHTYVTHDGSHDTYFWVTELHAWAPTMMATFAHPVAPPAAFDYRSADPKFSVWGWRFQADPARAMEFLDVTGASRGGLTLTGSGATKVLTAPLFGPRQGLAVTVDGVRTSIQRAGRDGRLALTVELGPAHRMQQFTAGTTAGELTGHYFTTRRVTIRPLA